MSGDKGTGCCGSWGMLVRVGEGPLLILFFDFAIPGWGERPWPLLSL